MNLKRSVSFLLLAGLFVTNILYNPVSLATEESGYDPVTIDANISFEAKLNSDGTVNASWTRYDHSEQFTFYKLVRSTTNTSPVYPEDGYAFFTENVNILAYRDTEVPAGTSYYRICQIAESKRYCSKTIATIKKAGEAPAASVTATVTSSSDGRPFIDIAGHWAENDIVTLAASCPSVKGFPTARGAAFRPDATITRAEMVALLGKCLTDNIPDESAGFSDVKKSDWFSSFIAYAKKKGFVGGYADGTFRPLRAVTRPEGLKMILLAKYTLEQIEDGDVPFKDVPVGSWFRRFVRFAYQKGFISGISPDRFGADRFMTRAEVAKLIVRVFGFKPSEPSNNNTNQNVNENRNHNENHNTNGTPSNTNENRNLNTNSVNTSGSPLISGCPIFPADNAWNQDVSSLPVHANSQNFINSIGNTTKLHADFGGNGEYGIPFVVVPQDQPMVGINFTAYGDESDPGPYPVPGNAPIEGGASSDGDRHVLVLQQGICKLYELYRSFPQRDGSWNADSGAVYDLFSNALRPEYWTSADAAGLPILPGLARYDEVAAGSVNHALRFTVSRSQKGFIHPATHYASSSNDANLPPMGLRVRMKADFDISRYTGQSRVILEGLKKYGMIVADNGSNWYITGAADTRWDDEDLNQLKTVPGSAFEAVDTGSIVK